MPDFGTCDTCGQTITGSHYHCSCGTTDVTGMYGHHGSICRLDPVDSKGRLKSKAFHHCGPDDCELRGATSSP